MARGNAARPSAGGRYEGRVHRTLRGERAQSSQSRKNAQREREPWVLVTSLSGGEAILQQVIEAYTKRMQIEEAFRDTQDEYYGLGLVPVRQRASLCCCSSMPSPCLSTG